MKNPGPSVYDGPGLCPGLFAAALFGQGGGFLAAQVLGAQLQDAQAVPIAVYGGGAVFGAVIGANFCARSSIARRFSALSVSSRTRPKTMTLR